MGDDAASFDLESVFYNDTMDGGNNDNEGDVQTRIRLRVNGDGRLLNSAEMGRRDAEGNNQRLELFDGSGRAYSVSVCISNPDWL